MSALFLLALALGGEGEPFLQPGDPLWVGHGMAEGYGLPFLAKLTVKKVRYLIMNEARVVFEENPKRPYYLRTDLGPNYAFLTDPRQTYAFTPEQWEDIRRGRIEIGMSKLMFLCIKPRPEEAFTVADEKGPIEQWVYRAEPVQLFGDLKQNPPTNIYYFQNNVLVAIL